MLQFSPCWRGRSIVDLPRGSPIAAVAPYRPMLLRCFDLLGRRYIPDFPKEALALWPLAAARAIRRVPVVRS